MGCLAESWEELSGKNYWVKHLNPLQTRLREYLIPYGELCGVGTDTIIWNNISKNAGTSRYSPENLLTKCGVGHLKYRVTKYIYATLVTPSSKESYWIGYVAVATDKGKVDVGRRDIVIAWRGTAPEDEMKYVNQNTTPIPAPIIFGEVETPKMHAGFYTYYTTDNEDSPYSKLSARDQVHAEVKKLVQKYKDEEVSITVTGHSLGAAMATVCAFDLAFNGINKTCHDGKEFLVTAFPFASPQVGDSSFSNAFNSVNNLRCLRTTNRFDSVPRTLPSPPYENVGQNLDIDTTKSPYLRIYGTPIHALEVYLHGILGCNGNGDSFRLQVKRSIGLVNKHDDALKEKYGIPPSWWAVKNNGMVQKDDGSWVFQDREDYPLIT